MKPLPPSLSLPGAALFGLLLAAACAPAPEPPPVLGEAPGFQLLGRHGSPVTLDDLRGEPFVLAFVFTRCVAVCPAMTAQMERLGRSLPAGEEPVLVSVTLDPEHDTPEVLAEYAALRGAPESWLFLTAEDRETTVRLAREGFKLPVEVDTGDPQNPIVHSTRLVLVDAEGRIRGYYDALDPEAMEVLERDLRALS